MFDLNIEFDPDLDEVVCMCTCTWHEATLNIVNGISPCTGMCGDMLTIQPCGPVRSYFGSEFYCTESKLVLVILNWIFVIPCPTSLTAVSYYNECILKLVSQKSNSVQIGVRLCAYVIETTCARPFEWRLN